MSALRIFETVRIFDAIIAGYFLLSPLRSAFAFDSWAHIVGVKKEMTEANKIMKLSFFF